MFITLVVPTITQYTKLHCMLTTVSEGTRRPDRIVVIDNGTGASFDELDKFAGLYDDWDVQLRNLGVAGSCNKALQLAAQQPGGYWLHANDDIEVDKRVINDLAQAAEAWPDQFMLCPAHNAGSAFTLFLMQAQRAIDEIGWWDEEFFPAYYEDNDYAYRMGLKGYHYQTVEGGSYIHHTSSTKNAYEGHQVEEGHASFRRNQQRYKLKWGNLPGGETFTVPFNRDLE